MTLSFLKWLCGIAGGICLSMFVPAVGATLSTNAAGNAWTWIKGANIAGENGSHGTQGGPGWTPMR